MAAFNRLTEATYEVHESVKVDTQDNEDHTFCGIMFPVKCRDLLPVDHISIRSLAVRGQLGPMTVWVSKEETNANATRNNRRINDGTTVFRLSKSHWHKIYEANHKPSPNEYATFVLDTPIILKPGQVRAIYIHSSLPGDQSIVYDNAAFYGQRGPFGRHGMGNDANHVARKPRYEDSMIQIHTGRAHVSNSIFGQMPIWGWGNAWRDHREFVGQIHYGAVYQLWNPETQIKFGPKFRQALFNLKLCQTRWESPISKLPDECIYFILNMCRWDWFQDSDQTMQLQLRQQKQKQRELQLEQQQEAERAAQQAQQREVGRACHQNCAGSKTTNVDEDDDDDSESQYGDAVETLEEIDGSAGGDDGELQSMDDDEDVDRDEDDEEDGDYDDDDDDEDEEEDEDDSEANEYRADHIVFRFIDPEQEEDQAQDESDEDGETTTQQAWMQRQFQRIHVLRALARQQDAAEDVVDMNLVF